MIDFERIPATSMSLSKRGLVCGVGVNDVPFVTTVMVNGKSQLYPPYSTWLNMLKRCYSPSFHARRPTYKNSRVSADWLKFSEFLKWWKVHQVHGWCIDKDILGDGSLYSPSTCIYVPLHINNFIEDSRASRGNLPIGVSIIASGKYHAYCRDNVKKKRVNIGYYDSIDEAAKARLDYKLQLALNMKTELDSIDPRLYQAIVTKVRQSI